MLPDPKRDPFARYDLKQRRRLEEAFTLKRNLLFAISIAGDPNITDELRLKWLDYFLKTINRLLDDKRFKQIDPTLRSNYPRFEIILMSFEVLIRDINLIMKLLEPSISLQEESFAVQAELETQGQDTNDFYTGQDIVLDEGGVSSLIYLKWKKDLRSLFIKTIRSLSKTLGKELMTSKDGTAYRLLKILVSSKKKLKLLSDVRYQDKIPAATTDKAFLGFIKYLRIILRQDSFHVTTHYIASELKVSVEELLNSESNIFPPELEQVILLYLEHLQNYLEI